MADPRSPDPRETHDPLHPDAARARYSDPAADPRVTNQTVVRPSSGRGGLIAAGVIAVLLVIALIAFSGGPGTDAGTTAVIPDQTETQPAPAPEAAPTQPAPPVETAPAAPEATPTEPAPPADQ